MSALGTIIDAAVGNVIAEHPKLFNPQGKERAQKVIVREIMKSLTREPRDAADDSAAAPENAAAIGDLIAAEDERAIAYCRLREIAGAVRPYRVSQDRLFLPPEADTTAVRALMQWPERTAWPFVTDRRHLTAWREYFDAALPDIPRRQILEQRDGITGACLPWPWPPSKTGKIYDQPPDEAAA